MADGDITVTTQLALFHIAIGHTRLGEHRHEGTQERFGFGGGTEVGLGDNLEERHACTVIVNQRATACVAEFTHIFFEVGVVNTDVLMLAHHIAGGTGQLDFHGPTDDDREILLGELVVLRVIWVEVVLPIPGATRGDFGTDD
jgi:hypothetical protein